LADFPIALVSDAARQRARGNASWLQQNRFAEGSEGRWDAGGLAGAGRRDDHRSAMRTHVRDDFIDMGIDRERRLHWQRALWRTTTRSITRLKARHRRTRRTIRPMPATTRPQTKDLEHTAFAK